MSSLLVYVLELIVWGREGNVYLIVLANDETKMVCILSYFTHYLVRHADCSNSLPVSPLFIATISVIYWSVLVSLSDIIVYSVGWFYV